MDSYSRIVAASALFFILDRYIPHLHFVSGREGSSSSLKRIWLFILAITIHNLPEGLAVGVGFGGGEFSAAVVLAVAVALQNMPEGLAVALPLVREGYSRGRAVFYALLSGMVEPITGFLGVLLVSLAQVMLPGAEVLTKFPKDRIVV